MIPHTVRQTIPRHIEIQLTQWGSNHAITSCLIQVWWPHLQLVLVKLVGQHSLVSLNDSDRVAAIEANRGDHWRWRFQCQWITDLAHNAEKVFSKGQVRLNIEIWLKRAYNVIINSLTQLVVLEDHKYGLVNFPGFVSAVGCNRLFLDRIWCEVWDSLGSARFVWRRLNEAWKILQAMRSWLADQNIYLPRN